MASKSGSKKKAGSNRVSIDSRVEEALLESKQMIKGLMDGISEPMILLDRNGIVLAANSALSQRINVPQDKLIGSCIFDAIDPDAARLRRAKMEEVLRTGKQVSFEDINNGRYVQSIVNPLFSEDGQISKIAVITIDITERKQAEAALKLTGYSLDNARDTIIWFCPDGRISYANNAACRMFGYSRDEMLSLTIFDLNPRYTRESWNDRWRELKSKGSTLYEVENRANDGHWFPIEATNTYIKYGDREFMFGYARDITERKRVEEALRESEAGLARSQEIAHLGSYSWDIVHDTIKWSDEHYRIVGCQPKEFPVTYETYLSFIHPGDREKVRKAIAVAIDEHQRLDIDYRVVRKDGVVRLAHSEGEAVYESGEPVRLFGTIEDITERREAEVALRESEEKFRVLTKSSSAMFWLYQGENFIHVNDAGEGLTGYTKDELLQMRFWDVVHPDDRDMVRERGLARQRGETVPSKYEVKLLTKAGEIRWAELTAGRIMYQGQPAGIATFFDITERKQAEEALKESKAQAELYLDLMGHDINNMHQIALGYLEIARDMHPEAGESEFLDKPIEVLQRSSRLIKNVRKLQKLKEGAFQSHEVDVCKMLMDVQREFGDVPHKAITLNLNGCDSCHVRANELLQDVFANLVSNAIKHTGDKADIDICMDVVNDNDGRYCQVSVEDNGPGIPDDFKDKIFNRMLKGTTKAKGMGLGLYLVKSLVESYSGRVWVEDRVPGDHTKGAKFIVMLPVT